MLIAAAAITFAPWGRFFGFVPLPGEFFPILAALTLAYLCVTEAAKRAFFAWMTRQRSRVPRRARG